MAIGATTNLSSGGERRVGRIRKGYGFQDRPRRGLRRPRPDGFGTLGKSGPERSCMGHRRAYAQQGLARRLDEMNRTPVVQLSFSTQ